MAYTHEEFAIYLKVRHELLLEDAQSHVADWFANNDSPVRDLTDEDYENLITEFAEHVDYTDPTYDVWGNIVNDYMEWMEDDEDEEG